MESVRDVLECTICLEMSASPIHTCTSGHVVCGICIDKILTCPQCKGNLAVNALAERTARRNEFIIQCPNSTEGCTKSLKSSEMKDHVVNSCGYRPIACMLKGRHSCHEGSLVIRDLFHHLTTVHELAIEDDTTTGKINSACAMRKLDDIDKWTWMKEFDGRKFLWFKDLKKGIVYDWVAVLGDKAIAAQYKFVLESPEIPSNSKVPAFQYPEFRWKLPVVPIHESKLDKAQEGGRVATMHSTTLAPFCEEYFHEDLKETFKYSWGDNMEIMKI